MSKFDLQIVAFNTILHAIKWSKDYYLYFYTLSNTYSSDYD